MSLIVGRKTEDYETKKQIMKRYNNLYQDICSYENLLLAHEKAKKGKAHYKEVQKIDKNPEKYLLALQRVLLNKTYRTIKKSFMKKIKNIENNWETMKTSQIINSIWSYDGWMKYANCDSLSRFYITEPIMKILNLKLTYE
jgi:hypothetical protein